MTGETTPDPRARSVLVALCVTVTVSYGVLYYAFTVLAPAIVDDTGWSATAVTAAFSAGSLFGALAGVVAGRALQRSGPRWVMTAGSVLGAGALALVGLAPSYPVFVLAWLVAGAASAGTFYPPAFVALTHWFGSGRVRAITTLTLVAGFASTVFAPLTAFLGDELGWRGTYLVLAGVMLVVTTPTHALALRLTWHATPTTHEHVVRDRAVLTSRTFLQLGAAGALAALAMYTSLVHLVPLLTEQGMSVQLAAWALGLSGAGQVLGRVLYPALDRILAPNPRAALILAVLAATLVVLAVVPGPATFLIAVAVVSGAARGLFTLVGATIVSDHWGTDRYAVLNGIFQAPAGIAAALSPAFGAAVAAATGGHGGLFAVLAVIALVSAALAATAGGDR
ncbi:MFS transporter [Nocardioides stalactiti]|uniref:MFS transporter n=1 Tax=Nocardioides stalactiti TaxID=2755356 RepID=UPI0035E4344D